MAGSGLDSLVGKLPSLPTIARISPRPLAQRYVHDTRRCRVRNLGRTALGREPHSGGHSRRLYARREWWYGFLMLAHRSRTGYCL